MTTAGERFARLETLKAEVAEALKLPLDAKPVTLYAGLWLAYEADVEKLVAGQHVDSGQMLSMAKSINELMPPPAQTPLKILVEIEDGGVCPHCHKSLSAPVLPTSPREIDLQATEIDPNAKALPSSLAEVAARESAKPKPPPIDPTLIPANEGMPMSELLGGFSAKTDVFGNARWPNPSR